MHPELLHLLRDLHDRTWLRLDGGYLIDTSLGSRQDCEFGAFIFNLMHCRALDDLRCALKNEGLLSEFDHYPEAAPWCHMACKSDGTQLEESSNEMCGISCVDDECVCFGSGIERRPIGEAPENT